MSGDPVALMAMFRTLADCEQTTFSLTHERTLLRCNSAWDRFVLAKGHPGDLPELPSGHSTRHPTH